MSRTRLSAATVHIRIGNQTSYAASRILEPFEFAASNGFTAFEFFPDRGAASSGGWDEGELNAEARQWIRETAAARNIALTVHAPLEFNPLSGSKSERLYSTVKLASDIGARLVNIHLDPSEGPTSFLKALAPVIHATAYAGLLLTLENTITAGPDDFNRFFACLNERTPKLKTHVGMCLDIGHANLFAECRNDYLKFADALSPQVPIRHLHLHENYGDCDSHLALFSGPARTNPAGPAGLVERLRQRSFDGCAILEQWPQPASLLLTARDRLMEVIRHIPPGD